MARISYQIFKGKQPKIAPQLLGEGQAQTATNCDLSSGELRPWDNESHDKTLEYRTTVQTIYYYLSTYWFEFTADVDIVESPVAGDTAYRRYWTGGGFPKKTNETEAKTGSAPYPINHYPLQVPIPATAPVIDEILYYEGEIVTYEGAVLTYELSDYGTAGSERDVSYLWTIVSSWGEESAPSDATEGVELKQGQGVSLSGMTLVWQASKAYTVDNWVIPTTLGSFGFKCSTAGTSSTVEPDWGQCTAVGDTIVDGADCVWTCVDKGILYDSGGVKRIYRTNIGDSTASWQLVASIGMAETTYIDSTTDDNLEATILPSEDWDSPPEALAGLVSLSNGSLAGFVGKDVYLSEPNYPHAWPYRKTVESTVIALAAIGNTLVIMTDRNPEYYYGTHPNSMTPKKLPDPRACASKRGVVNFTGGVLYPSEFGYELMDGTGRKTITENYYTKKEWADVYPSTLNAVFANNKIFAFYSSGGNEGGIVIDLATETVTDLDFYSSAVYVDPSTETLYFVKQVSEVLLLENGTASPSRTNGILLESGDYLLLES